jgi:HSP20 family protein
MRRAKVRRMPVVDDGDLKGILALNDIVEAVDRKDGDIDYEEVLNTMRRFANTGGKNIRLPPRPRANLAPRRPSPDKDAPEHRINWTRRRRTMAEITVTKQPKRERDEISRSLGFEAPLFRGSLFGLNPFALMRQFTEDMDRTFGQLPNGGARWRPAIEVKENEGKLVVCAELPGVKKEDVKVNITDNALTLEGERKEEKEEKREGYYHCERSYGKFFRSIPLPEGARTEQAAAQFKDGVLEISVPIPEVKETSQQIPIK